MIRYSLKCANGHRYDAWFASSAAYDALAKAGQLQCPECGVSDVAKALMAPNISTVRRKDKQPERAPAAAPSQANPAQQEAVRMMRHLRAFIEKNSEYVGPRFAEEARSIHLEESDARSIYGEASPEDLAELREEGIEFFPMPVLPEDHN